MGVNRTLVIRQVQLKRIPHACGGEPFWGDIVWDYSDVFPTRVGVNRCLPARDSRGIRIPHACGGEPTVQVEFRRLLAYSPRVWG